VTSAEQFCRLVGLKTTELPKEEEYVFDTQIERLAKITDVENKCFDGRPSVGRRHEKMFRSKEQEEEIKERKT